MTAPGRVILVGAGPGDPGLMTLRGVQALRDADVVLSDRLVPAGMRELARAHGAEVIDVGKQGGGEQVPQGQTNRLLLQYARAGRLVVRLKGGDPFVFGRGGEEALLCRSSGIAFEVVPGVTSGVAAAAYAGIPVTQRGLAAAVAFVTGHEDPAKPETTLDWPALAAFPGTLVFYMGVRALPRIASSLIEGGRPADEPVAVVQNGTLPGQRRVSGTLADIADAAAAARIAAPSITIVGPVAALAADLDWLGEQRTLAGLTIVVTRAQPHAGELADRLRALGAEAIEAPAIETRPLPVTTPELKNFDLLCITSSTAVTRLFEILGDARAFAGPRIAVIGTQTRDALRARGIEADIVPGRMVAEGLLEAIDAVAGPPVRRALIARAREGRDVLPQGLRGRGVEVALLALYETISLPVKEIKAADYVTFTAGSTVRGYLAGAQPPPGARLVSIGPATSAELRAHGLQADVEATVHTPGGLIDALLADAAAGPRNN